jgi:MinD superfamily P-loop ATPase
MKIAVLSGKGGTGKTLVSVNLAAAASKSTYVDCDVEEPNGHLFFKPEKLKEKPVKVSIPSLDENLCSGCRKCVDFCKFNALAFINNKPMLFEEVCHSCGGCILFCPQKALSEKSKKVGKVEFGKAKDVNVITGIMNLGEASGIPIISEMFKSLKDKDELIILDCPPGSGCMAMESIKYADYCVLVAEPTLFGTHNLNMVYELVKIFNKPFGVVLNKCVEGENLSEEFCKGHSMPILESIPFDYELGGINSNGRIATFESNKYSVLFSKLLKKILKEVHI